MRILVTGATGFIGSHLSSSLDSLGHDIITIERDTVKNAFGSIYITAGVKGDLVNLETVERAISDYEVSCVIHLAAQTDVRIAYKDPLSTFESNIKGTWNVLEACRRQNVGRVIVASSDKSYGWTPPPYKESDPVRASGVYETSKTCADLLAQSYAKTYGMSIAITRCGNFYGPGRLNWETLIPGTIKSIIEGKKPVLRSDGKFRRDFLHVEDGVSAYTALVNSKLDGPFNFGWAKPIEVIEVVNIICKEMKWTGGIDIIPTAKNEIVDQYLDITRAKEELKWAPKIEFEDGIRSTINWYKRFLVHTGAVQCS
mgnify:CR=1 FL=1